MTEKLMHLKSPTFDSASTEWLALQTRASEDGEYMLRWYRVVLDDFGEILSNLDVARLSDISPTSSPSTTRSLATSIRVATTHGF